MNPIPLSVGIKVFEFDFSFTFTSPPPLPPSPLPPSLPPTASFFPKQWPFGTRPILQYTHRQLHEELRWISRVNEKEEPCSIFGPFSDGKTHYYIHSLRHSCRYTYEQQDKSGSRENGNMSAGTLLVRCSLACWDRALVARGKWMGYLSSLTGCSPLLLSFWGIMLTAFRQAGSLCRITRPRHSADEEWSVFAYLSFFPLCLPFYTIMHVWSRTAVRHEK